MTTLVKNDPLFVAGMASLPHRYFDSKAANGNLLIFSDGLFVGKIERGISL
jgi:hypothetical protein